MQDQISWKESEDIFQKAHLLAAGVYRCTQNFPGFEGRGLVYEMKESTLAVSAFLSDALRKDQKPYLLNVLESVERRLENLRRNLQISRLLAYLAQPDFQELDETVESLKGRVRLWRESLLGVGDWTIQAEPSPAPAREDAPPRSPGTPRSPRKSLR